MMAVTIQGVSDKQKALITGSTDEFDRLFQEHWNRIYGMLYRLLGDPDEAQDLALETFWRLYSNPPRQAENLAGWLSRVAVRLGYNTLRAKQRRAQYEQKAGQEWLFAYDDDPTAQADRLEQLRTVRQVLAEMSGRSAHILLLRHSGFSYVEIGAAMKIPVTSVGTLLSRAEQEFEKRFRALTGDASQ